MDRNKQINAISESDNEKMTLIRVCDKIERAMERNIAASTAFLSSREQALVKQILPQCEFFGGTLDTERKVAYWLPEYLTIEDYFEDTIDCISASFYEKNALSHRDILGALMGSGIRRETIGDIIVHENSCEIFVLSELSKYLMDNLTSAGRHHLQLTKIDPKTVHIPPQNMKLVRCTVSALRFDSVIASGFHMSRSSAAESIRAGQAAINSLTCQKPDRSVAQGDLLSVRGMGKMKIVELHGNTRKDRFALTLGIYL